MKIDTRLLMISSAILMGMAGFAFTFFPGEILTYLGFPAFEMGRMFLQITGALYWGFSILNWTARAIIIGGIYSRPVALGNFLHFTVVTIMLLKMIAGDHTSPIILIGGLFYGLFAISFGL
ncbi:MAG: hypothetical protein PVH63_07315, partial [Balneolaceae bacterium]